jgi:hypothetical protein
MVEEIEEFQAELSGDMLRDFEILVNAQVHVPRWRARTKSDSRSPNVPQLEAVYREHIGIQIRLRIGTTGPARLTGDAVRPLPTIRSSVADA